MTDLLTHAIDLTPGERDMINRDLITLSNIRNLSHDKLLKHISGVDIMLALYFRARDARRDLASDLDRGYLGLVGLS